MWCCAEESRRRQERKIKVGGEGGPCGANTVPSELREPRDQAFSPPRPLLPVQQTLLMKASAPRLAHFPCP